MDGLPMALPAAGRDYSVELVSIALVDGQVVTTYNRDALEAMKPKPLVELRAALAVFAGLVDLNLAFAQAREQMRSPHAAS